MLKVSGERNWSDSSIGCLESPYSFPARIQNAQNSDSCAKDEFYLRKQLKAEWRY